MFKSNINKENNYYISKEEVEKIYEHQKKLFDSKIKEQQTKINELVNYISAKFGEDFGSSNIVKQVKQLEKNLQKLETECKTTIEKNNELLKKEIEKSDSKIFVELDRKNKEQTEIYNKYLKTLEKNENNIVDIQNILSQKNAQISDLNKFVQGYVQENLAYKKEIQEKFENTNKKIGKINYLGITGKFDKKLREENKKLEAKIEDTKSLINGNIVNIEKETYKNNKDISEQITKLAEFTQNNVIEIDKLNKKLNDDAKNINEQIISGENKIKQLQLEIEKNIAEIKDTTQNSINQLSRKTNENNSNLIEETKQLIQKTKDNKQSIDSINEKITSEIDSVNKILNNKVSIEYLEKKFEI